MERRDEKRRARRVPVRFWKRGEDKPHSGFTTNISRGGMFIVSNLVQVRGTRMRIEVLDPIHGFVVEGVVARAIRNPPVMQRIQPSGMGLRFLQVAELVEELFPSSQDRPKETPLSGGLPPSEGSSSAVGTQPAEAPSSSEALPSSEDAASSGEVSSGETVSSGEVSSDDTAAMSAKTVPAYLVQFRNRGELQASFERDISQGGLFITTPHLAPLYSVIVIEIRVLDDPSQAVRLQAKVVHCVEPESDVEPNLLAGMGLELLNQEQALTALRPLLG